MPYGDDIDTEEVDKVGVVFTLVIIGLIIAAIALSGCTYADATKVVFVGGKGAYKSKQFALTTDNTESFHEVAMLGAIAVPAIQAIKVAQSNNALSASQTASAASVTKNASNNATKVVLGAQKSNEVITKATVLPK